MTQCQGWQGAALQDVGQDSIKAKALAFTRMIKLGSCSGKKWQGCRSWMAYTNRRFHPINYQSQKIKG
ncbi:hypothetical protein A9Q73_01805 [Bermanella sp. 47_1433_sub80_T6]|nr:hypothetical protein A9Q73_01805 [Bermanella sp. 47_1433_sub80_T6]